MNLNHGVCSLRGFNADQTRKNSNTTFNLPHINTVIIHPRHKLGSRKNKPAGLLDELKRCLLIVLILYHY